MTLKKNCWKRGGASLRHVIQFGAPTHVVENKNSIFQSAWFGGFEGRLEFSAERGFSLYVSGTKLQVEFLVACKVDNFFFANRSY